jgi:hypothetical protein
MRQKNEAHDGKQSPDIASLARSTLKNRPNLLEHDSPAQFSPIQTEELTEQSHTASSVLST